MKVIMLKTIEKVGKQGEIVAVKRGFARNYLTPRGYAIYATPSNMKNLAVIQDKLKVEEEKMLAELKKLAEIINATNVTFERKLDEHGSMFGSVSENDIVHALQLQDITIHKSNLVMDKHFKEIGEFRVPVRLHKDLSCDVKVIITAEQEKAQEPVQE